MKIKGRRRKMTARRRDAEAHGLVAHWIMSAIPGAARPLYLSAAEWEEVCLRIMDLSADHAGRCRELRERDPLLKG